STQGPSGLPAIVADGGHTLTIDGNGGTITRTGSVLFRHMLVAGGSLIVRNITFSNGSSTTGTNDGGSIRVQAGSLTIDHARFLSNVGGGGSAYGGAFALKAGTTGVVTNSAFINNSTIISGGAIANE